MKRGQDQHLGCGALMFVLVILAAALFAMRMHDEEDRARCVASGGRVAEIHGNRYGGWVCEGGR